MTMRAVLRVLVVAMSLAHRSPAQAEDSYRPSKWPLVYRDEASDVTIRVEADGRHVYATRAKGKLLWRRDPFKDGRLEPYRTRYPRIVWLGPPSQFREDQFRAQGRFVGISFSSSQFGIINVATGEFIFLGQD